MGIKFDEARGTYEASFSKRDPETRMPKRFVHRDLKTEAAAERALSNLKAKASLFFSQRTGEDMPYSVLLQKFYDSLQDRDLSNATVDNYRLCLDAHTLPVWGNRAINSIKPDEIRRLIRETLAKKSRSHQKSMLKYIKGAFNFAVEAGHLTRSPVPLMQFRLGTKFKAVLNEKQIGILLDKAREYEHEWYPHWTLAAYSGLRNEEQYPLTWNNVNLDDRLIYVRCSWTKKDGYKDLTKSGDDRAVEIAQPLVTLLRELRLRNCDSTYVLPRIDDWDSGRQAEILRNFLIGLNLPPITYHNLRASWATVLLSKGVPLAKVMKLGGWKTLNTLEKHYLRLSGVDIRGSTDDLKFHDPGKKPGQLLQMPKSSTE